MVPPEPPEAADSKEPAEENRPASDQPQPAEAESTEAGPDKPGPADDEPDAESKPDAATEVLPEVGPPTRRSNVRLIVATALALLVLAGGGVTIVALASDKRPEDVALQQNKAEARVVVEKFVALFEQARNDGVFAVSKSDVKAVLCAREQDGLDQEWQERENKEIARSYAPTPAARLAMSIKDIRIDGDKGVAKLSGTQEDRRIDQDYELVKEESQWRVCGLVFRTPSSSRSASSSTSSTEHSFSEPTYSESDSATTSSSQTVSETTSTSFEPL